MRTSHGNLVMRFLGVLAAWCTVWAGFTIISTATSGPAAASSEAPIVIGALCSCTGPLAAGANEFQPYQAWIDTVNHAGGINGHQVKLVQIDDQSNPGQSIADVKTLVQSDHIIALVDASQEDAGWATYIQGTGVPVVGSGNSTEPFFMNSDFYAEGQTEDALFASVVESAKLAKAKSMSLIYCAEAIQCQQGIAPLKQAGHAGGVPVTVASEVSASAPSYTAQCLTSEQAHVGAVFVADTFVVATKLATDCAQQSYNPTYVVDGLDLADTFTSIKGALYAPVPNVPFFAKTPALTTMNAAFDKYFPGMRKNTALYGEGYAALWTSGKLFQAAAEAGGLGANGTAPTSAEVVKGLTSLKGATLGGLAPPLTFPAGKPHPIDCWFVSDMKNGKFGLPVGTKTECLK